MAYDDVENDTEITQPKLGKLIIAGGTQWDRIGRKGKPEDPNRPDLLSPHVYRSVAEIKFKKVITGPSSCHHVLIDDQGQAYVFGRNEHGQLGVGHTRNINDPTLLSSFGSVVKDLNGHKFKSAATGRGHTLLLSETGAVYAAGENRLGQCGHGNLKGTNTFVLVEGLLKLDIVDVACGADFSVALTKRGQVYSWGSPQYGQLGNGKDGKYFSGSREAFTEEPDPILVKALQDRVIIKIACGQNHTLALDDQNYVYAWGFGGYGRLGMNDQQDQYIPKVIPHFDGSNPVLKVTDIAAGATCTMVLDGQSSLWLCGKWKLTGDGSAGSPWMYPKSLYDLQGWKFRHIAGGGVTLFAISDAEQTTICWGQGALHGELGYGEGKPKSQTKPARLDSLLGIEIDQIGAGMGTTLFIAIGPVDKIADLPKFPHLKSDPSEVCIVCHQEDNDDKILLCDKCDNPMHTYCARPPLDKIPDGEWFCEICRPLPISESIEKDGKTKRKRKKIEDGKSTTPKRSKE